MGGVESGCEKKQNLSHGHWSFYIHVTIFVTADRGGEEAMPEFCSQHPDGGKENRLRCSQHLHKVVYPGSAPAHQEHVTL